MSLRLRVALVAGLTSLAVVTVAGVALLAFVRRDQARALDARLEQQARVAAQRAATLVASGTVPEGDDVPAARGSPDLNTVGRVRNGDEVPVTFGDFPLTAEIRPPMGFSTDEIGGESWRILALPADEAAPGLAERALPEASRSSVIVEVATPTAPARETVAAVRRLVLRLGAGAMAVAALGGWLLGGAALRPLARLRQDTERVAGSDRSELRVADDQGLPEVDELGRALNGMLDRIRVANQRTEDALEASRAFAANAAHELRTPLTSMQANLEVLARADDLDPDDRRQILDEVMQQEQRLLRLLEALRLLARGDLADALPADEISVVDLATEAVGAARRRHPDGAIDLVVHDDDGDLDLHGWREGLRVLLDNLLDNAARHGRRPGTPAHIVVTVSSDGGEITLVVDDAGPGLDESERDRVIGRFVRGTGAEAGGSGLGLALVAQQAALHHGRVELTDSPMGGLRVVVRLPPSSSGATADR